ncbi:hypothetical protein [Bradyrhizobium sp. STM 3562]|uniref:hypothetical protein n=1 Tax=Bradyrhizobium sp. STM 3562 TaxID=578924 RepID=UPI00388EA9A6
MSGDPISAGVASVGSTDMPRAAEPLAPKSCCAGELPQELASALVRTRLAYGRQFRTTERNLGVAPHLIEISPHLVLDAQYWEDNTHPADELALRFHPLGIRAFVSKR